jgi:LppM domain
MHERWRARLRTAVLGEGSGVRTRIARAIALGAIALLLTGCIKLDMDLEVSADDTVSGTVVFAFSKQLLQLTGQSADELFKGSASSLPSGVPGTSAAPYEDDRFVGQKITFDHVELSRFNSEGSDLTIERVNDEFHVTGSMDLSSSTTGSSTGNIGDISQFGSSAQISITLTFPGKVITSTTGAVHSNSVTWTPKLGETTDLTTVASAVPSDSFPWMWVLIGVGVLVLAAVLFLVFVNRRGGSAAPAERASSDEALAATSALASDARADAPTVPAPPPTPSDAAASTPGDDAPPAPPPPV